MFSAHPLSVPLEWSKSSEHTKQQIASFTYIRGVESSESKEHTSTCWSWRSTWGGSPWWRGCCLLLIFHHFCKVSSWKYYFVPIFISNTNLVMRIELACLKSNKGLWTGFSILFWFFFKSVNSSQIFNLHCFPFSWNKNRTLYATLISRKWSGKELFLDSIFDTRISFDKDAESFWTFG